MHRTHGFRWRLIVFFIVGWTIAVSKSPLIQSTNSELDVADSTDLIQEVYIPVLQDRPEVAVKVSEEIQEKKNDPQPDVVEGPVEVVQQLDDPLNPPPLDLVSDAVKARQHDKSAPSPPEAVHDQLTKMTTPVMTDDTVFPEEILPLPHTPQDNDGLMHQESPVQGIL